MRYTVALIKRSVESDIDRLFAPWAVGRPENWSVCSTTKPLIALHYWLKEELDIICDDSSTVRLLLQKYNRLSRSHDLWESACECLNDVIDDTIPEFDSRRCRRWG